jgi:hypothetical protein
LPRPLLNRAVDRLFALLAPQGIFASPDEQRRARLVTIFSLFSFAIGLPLGVSQILHGAPGLAWLPITGSLGAVSTLANRALTTLSNMLTDLNLTDMETCYKAWRSEVSASFELREERFGFEPEFTAKVAARGYRIYEVPISYSGRSYDEGKKIGFKDAVEALYCIVRYNVFDK